MANKKENKIVSFIFVAILIVAVCAVTAIGYTYVQKDIAGDPSQKEEVTIVIKDNDYEYEVGEKLASNKIVISDMVWSWWMEKHYPDFTYYNGEYNMTTGMSYEEIAQKLKNPDVSHKKVSVCIPEGYDVFQIADIVDKNGICSAKDFLSACTTTDYDYEWLADFPKDDSNIGYILEGFLFPATYDMPENSEASDVVDLMLDAFDKRITDDITSYCQDNDMSLYQFVTLSSIVQEEALSKDSQGNIASVLINRLNKGSKLQCDVTYYYAKKLRDNGYSQDVYDAYYTYRCPALPAGPISNPGSEIMNSVVSHPDTDYLFFFSDLSGDFHFAATSQEFEQQKAKYPWKVDKN